MTTATHLDVPCGKLIALLRAHEPKLRNLGLVSVAMFGSRARGDNRPDSDLDLLVDYDRGSKFSLLDLAHIQNYLIDLIGCDVQLTTHDALRPQSLQAIKAQAIEVF